MTKNEMIGMLCRAVEDSAGFKMLTPTDFNRLSELVFERQHVTISTSTLRRIWGYAGQSTVPRVFTLDTLAHYIGSKDFETFCMDIGRTPDVQSRLFLSDTITVDTLKQGARLQLSWQPDRVCVVEHLGSGMFRVARVKNTKLQEGDVFECHLFINHEPLYIDRLQRGTLPPLSYVAGRQSGVSVRLVEE